MDSKVAAGPRRVGERFEFHEFEHSDAERAPRSGQPMAELELEFQQLEHMGWEESQAIRLAMTSLGLSFTVELFEFVK